MTATHGHVSRARFAAIYGCGKPYVTQLAKEGRLVLSADGKLVDADASLQLLRATQDPAKAAVREHWQGHRERRTASATGASAARPASPVPPDTRRTRAAPKRAPGPGRTAAGSAPSGLPPATAGRAPAVPEEAVGASTPSAYHLAKTRREQAAAEMAELELARQRGEVLDAEAILRGFTDVMTAARNELLALPDRLTPLVAPESDMRTVYGLIEAETERTCQLIASRLQQLRADVAQRVEVEARSGRRGRSA